jgi:hypothetical protein
MLAGGAFPGCPARARDAAPTAPASAAAAAFFTAALLGANVAPAASRVGAVAPVAPSTRRRMPHAKPPARVRSRNSRARRRRPPARHCTYSKKTRKYNSACTQAIEYCHHTIW